MTTTPDLTIAPDASPDAARLAATTYDLILTRIEYNRGDNLIEIRAEKDEARIRVGMWRPDTFTGEHDYGFGGWYRLSQHATDSEIVAAVFGLFKAYEEHEAREAFLWDGRRVFGPHMDVRALWEVAERTDARPAPTARSGS